MDETRGLVFDIQGFSVHDGPGCRTLVFLSGCPLRCAWCSNPEGLLTKPRLLYRRSRCGCGVGRCAQACPRGAIGPAASGPGIEIARSRCAGCTDLACVRACYREALAVCGNWLTKDGLMRVLRRDRACWGQDGGVTLGGGDPLAQMGFSREILAACSAEGIHTAVETCAHAPTGEFLALMRHVRWAFIDLKHMDPARHVQGTGRDNCLILKNIRALLASGWPGTLMLRMPVIPGYNDDGENLARTAEFVKSAGLRELNALPFHRLGESKYGQLGAPWGLSGQASASAEVMAAVRQAFAAAGIECYVGHDTPF